MSPRSPISTLFPYTTLFRSALAEIHYQDGDFQEALRYYGALLEAGIDRKSTRLNSSHVAISYAAFCLTKKKKPKKRNSPKPHPKPPTIKASAHSCENRP